MPLELDGSLVDGGHIAVGHIHTSSAEQDDRGTRRRDGYAADADPREVLLDLDTLLSGESRDLLEVATVKISPGIDTA